MAEKRGRVTIPTDLDVIRETLDIMKEWGADAIRDCDGTEFPQELKDTGSKIYATYYTTRKDNDWAKAHPEEIQQMYIMTSIHTAVEESLEIHLMDHLYPDMLAVNTRDDIRKWWEVMDRTTGQPVPCEKWSYHEETGNVRIQAVPFHQYTVSFLAYIMWDPVHMYNAVVNDWKDVEPQMTFDVRQPATREYSLKRLRRFLETHDYVDVVRFTTFFHQFTLIFDEMAREKYVDWYGYSASVSPYILEQFEKEVGYPFRPEYIIDQGYMNNTYRIPSKEFRDFQTFQRREVALLAKQMVDIVHEYGKEAMMFMGDHWIGMEPFMDEFAQIGLDAVVGSVGNGATLRLFSDIKHVKYTEGRFLPYFFPDTFHEGNDPVIEAVDNWLSARRAIMRKPIDRIGYGGYPSLAYKFPKFVEYIEKVCEEFRQIYDIVHEQTPYCGLKVAILNHWGALRSWHAYMVAHGLYCKQIYSYNGMLESLSGASVDVTFISFDELLEHGIPADIDVIINAGDANTAFSGGDIWKNEMLVSMLRAWVYSGHGLVGIGEPTACEHGGRFFQLADAFGVDKELGFTLHTDKYFHTPADSHFITEDVVEPLDFGEGMKNIYALYEDTEIIAYNDGEVNMAAHAYGKGRCVYIAGLPYSTQNTRILLRALYYAACKEEAFKKWYADNLYCEVHAYPQSKQYAILNNTNEIQETGVYDGEGNCKHVTLQPGEIRWMVMK